MLNLRGLLNKILELGTESIADQSELDRIVLSNKLSLILSFIASLYIVLFPIIELPKLGIIASITTLGFLFVIFLNWKQFFITAKIFLELNVAFTLFYFSSTLGRSSGIQTVFFSHIILPFVIFNFNQKKLIFFSVLFSLVCYGMLELTNYGLLSRIIISNKCMLWIHISSVSATLLINVISIIFFLVANESTKLEINRKNEDLIIQTQTSQEQTMLAQESQKEAEKERNKTLEINEKLILETKKREVTLENLNYALQLAQKKEAENKLLLEKELEDKKNIQILKNQAESQNRILQENLVIIENQNQFLENQKKKLERALQYERDIKKGSQVQAMTLPQTRPEEIFLEVVYIPARGMSGDTWNWRYLGKTKIFVFLADVQGKGVASSYAGIIFNERLALYLENYPNPESLSLAEITRKMQIMADRPPFDRLKVALVAFLIDIQEKILYCLNAGVQVAPVFQGKINRVFESQGPPIGYDISDEYPIEFVRFEPGDRLIAGSDGLEDIQNKDGERFGEERCQTLIKNIIGLPKEEVLPRSKESLLSFQNEAEQPDDVTILFTQW